jgi:hypothetical protein
VALGFQKGLQLWAGEFLSSKHIQWAGKQFMVSLWNSLTMMLSKKPESVGMLWPASQAPPAGLNSGQPP